MAAKEIGRGRVARAAAAVATSGLTLGLTVGIAESAEAATGSGVVRTAWQMQDRPDAPYPLAAAYPHGDPAQYVGAQIPAANDADWVAAPDPDTIAYGPGSRLWDYGCGSVADYSYFQSFVYVPAGEAVSDFRLGPVSVDDGVRVTIFNAAFPGGAVSDPDSYVLLWTNQPTGNLASYLRPGVNRVVVTQVDDCYSGSDLFGASIEAEGAAVPIGYGWDGFLQPINDTAHQIGQALSVFKAGSTVPVKLVLRAADGTLVQGPSAPVFLKAEKGSAMSAPVDEAAYTAPGTTGSDFRYDPATQQYVFNWKTDKAGAGFWWRLFVQLPDGTTKHVTIGLR